MSPGVHVGLSSFWYVYGSVLDWITRKISTLNMHPFQNYADFCERGSLNFVGGVKF